MKFHKEKDSIVRSMFNFAHGIPYVSIKSIKKARKKNAYVIMEGDWGGQIYLTCPLKYIKCNEKKLKEILQYLDNICWCCSEGVNFYYEIIKDRKGIAGGMGGGAIIDGLWLHPNIEEKNLRKEIEEMLFTE